MTLFPLITYWIWLQVLWISLQVLTASLLPERKGRRMIASSIDPKIRVADRKPKEQ